VDLGFYSNRPRAVNEFIDVVRLARSRYPSPKTELARFVATIRDSARCEDVISTARARGFVTGDEADEILHTVSLRPAESPDGRGGRR
jgi:hypothetical protein